MNFVVFRYELISSNNISNRVDLLITRLLHKYMIIYKRFSHELTESHIVFYFIAVI